MKKIRLLSITCIILSHSLIAEECDDECDYVQKEPVYEWIDGSEVAVLENGIYIETNKGMMRINVVEYDRGNDRYLVKRTFRRGYYGDEQLACFSDEESK